MPSETYSSVKFFNQTTGWLSGTGGHIYKTTNGGADWILQSNDSYETVNKIEILDSENGWIAGENGSVGTTTNGGNQWISKKESFCNYAINSSCFIDANTGWIVALTNAYHTTDGGLSWTKQTTQTNSGPKQALYGVVFKSSTKGWACGGNGLIVNTTDGGSSWNQQTSGTTSLLNDICFTDENNVWACGKKETLAHSAWEVTK